MHPDWTTFVLEIVNFLILIWILKRFLYAPVLKAISDRRARIERTLEDATRAKEEADSLKSRYEGRLKDWERERETAREKLALEIEAERGRRIKGLEGDLADERERNRVLEARTRDEAQRTMQEQALAQGARFAAALLSRLETADLQSSLRRMLVEDLQRLPSEEVRRVLGANAAEAARIRVECASPLDAGGEAEITRALRAFAGRELPVDFEPNPGLRAGFRVTIGPWVLHANVADELEAFAKAGLHAG